ncbi:MAG: DinB family protein [Planctomycetota bacterium]|jgi:uncharacterized damage-inducible protein DinB
MNTLGAHTIEQLVEYELSCNRRCLDAFDTLPDNHLHTGHGFGHVTLHRTVFHILDVMRQWSHRVGPVEEEVGWLEYSPDYSVAQLRGAHEEIAVRLLEGLQQSYVLGVLDEGRRLHRVFHLVTHGSHHRSQMLSMFSLLGYAPPFEGGDFGGWSYQQAG